MQNHLYPLLYFEFGNSLSFLQMVHQFEEICFIQKE